MSGNFRITDENSWRISEYRSSFTIVFLCVFVCIEVAFI